MNSMSTADFFNTDFQNNHTFHDINESLLKIFNETYYDLFREFYKRFGTWWQIAVIIIIIEICTGLTGNVFSLIVWNTGERSSKMACSTYFKILAATDILTLVSGIFGVVLPHFFDIMETNYCAVLGIVFNILIPLAPQLSAWTIVSISIERMLSLCFPFRFHKQGYKRRAWLAFSVIIILLTGINYDILLCSNFVSEGIFSITFCTCVGRATIGIRGVSMLWFLYILPFVAVAFCNIVIAVRLCWVRHSRVNLNSSNRQNRVRTFTKLCIGAAILHFVSVMPVSTAVYYGYRSSSLKTNETELVKLYEGQNSLIPLSAALFSMLTALFYLNNSLNFLLYCFTGSNFRNDLKILFICRICKSSQVD